MGLNETSYRRQLLVFGKKKLQHVTLSEYTA
jgi:hypothetical protein